VHSWRHWVYIGSEHGNVQVVDCSNPASPTLVGTFGSPTHTLNVDQEAGILYLSGGAQRGIALYDLNVSPTNPPRIAIRRSPYVHDGHAVRGHAYLAEMFSGTFSIVDVSNPTSMTTLSTTTTPSRFPHNVWVTEDDVYAIVTEENHGDCFTVYDVSNKAAPAQINRWCSPNGATVHNIFIDGSIAHLSCYSDGYWVIDFSDPTNLRTIGQFDSSTFGGNDYVGCWGAYPFQPSGVVYLSDMQSGFWIVEPTCGVPRRYGNATAGSGGIEPRIDFEGGYPKVGNATFTLHAMDLVGGASTAFLIGAQPTSQVMVGFELLVDPTLIVGISVTASGTSGVAGDGEASLNVPIPNVAGLALDTFYCQAIALDSAAPQGISASRGLRFAICP